MDTPITVIDAQSSGQLFFYGQEVANYLTPPIGAAFVLAVSWRGANEMGTFWGLVIGTLLGLIRLVMTTRNDFIYLSDKSKCSVPYYSSHLRKVQ